DPPRIDLSSEGASNLVIDKTKLELVVPEPMFRNT
ncbi:hypothetical protein EVAR_47615_1, partial [Eumeta japonica]